MRKLILGLILLLATPALAATTYYVRTDGDDTLCNGTADTGYIGMVAPDCGFKTIQKCVDSVAAGDTCLIHSGTYITACNQLHGSNNPNGGVNIDNKSGTAAFPITLRGYPGDTPPVLCGGQCSSSNSTTGCAAILLYSNASYWVISGLHIKGMIRLGTSDSTTWQTVSHNTIRNNEFEVGSNCDGNYPMLYLTHPAYTQIDHNLFHNMDFTACYAERPDWTSSSAFFKSYHDEHTVFEYNTTDIGAGPSTPVYAWDLKSCPRNGTYRYNQVNHLSIRTNSVPGKGCEQLPWPTNGVTADNNVFNGNLFIGGSSDGIQLGSCSLHASDGAGNRNGPKRNVTGWQLTNNTFVSYSRQWGSTDCADDNGYFDAPIDRDNMFAPGGGSGPGGSVSYNVYNCQVNHTSNWTMDYNVYDSNKVWDKCVYSCNCTTSPACGPPRGSSWTDGSGGTSDFTSETQCQISSYPTLAAWRTTSSLDAHSSAYPGGCSLDSGYKIVAGSPCLTASSVGGKVGFEAATSCVGYQCATSGPVCGNGTVESGEQCDPPGAVTTCTSIGPFISGNATCNAGCLWNTSTCISSPTFTPNTSYRNVILRGVIR